MRVHLDTGLGGDTDDVCALALLLKWPDVEVVGIITTADSGGRRAGRPEGRPTRVMVDLDGTRFGELWLSRAGS